MVNLVHFVRGNSDGSLSLGHIIRTSYGHFYRDLNFLLGYFRSTKNRRGLLKGGRHYGLELLGARTMGNRGRWKARRKSLSEVRWLYWAGDV